MTTTNDTATSSLPATGTRNTHEYTHNGCIHQWAHDHDQAECYAKCPWTTK